MTTSSFITITFILAAVFCCTQAAYITGAGCSASADIELRATNGMWQDELTLNPQKRINSVYDITVTNTGSCPAKYIGLTISFPSEFVVTQSWNLDFGSLYTSVIGFGDFIDAGVTYTGAGLVLARNVTIRGPVSVTVYGTACDEACIGGDSAPASSEPFPVDSVSTAKRMPQPAAIRSRRDTELPDYMAACGVSVTGIWDPVYVGTYIVVITNTGTCAIRSLQLSFTVTGGEISSTTNLTEDYHIKNFGGMLFSGQVFDGANIQVPGGATVVVDVADVEYTAGTAM